MDHEQPAELKGFTRFLIKESGIGTELVDLYATASDIPALRNRAAAQGATFFYLFTTMAIAGEATFAKPGEFEPMPIILAFGLAYLLCIRMDAFVNLRGLYAQGRRQLRKLGLKLPYDSDDVAWFLLLLARAGVGMAVAIIAGTLSAQVFFRSEIRTELASQVSPRNAAIVAFHTKAVDAELKVAHDNRDRDAKEVTALKVQQTGLLKRETQLSAGVTTSNARRQADIAAKREANSETLGSFGRLIDAADAKAAASSQTYKALEASRNTDLWKRIESDPQYTKPPEGLLAAGGALKQLAFRDPAVAAGIALVDFLGLALEAWILILALASPPTKLAVNLYRDVLRHASDSARALAAELRGKPDSDEPIPTPPDSSPPSLGGAAAAFTTFGDVPPPPLRRGRGRPRKNPVPAVLTS